MKKNIDKAMKGIHKLEIKFDASSNPNEKINIGLEIIKIIRFLVSGYSLKGIPTFLPEPQQMLSDYEKKLNELSLSTETRESYAHYGDPRVFFQKLKYKDMFSDMKWCCAPGDKTCDICSNRNEKTVEEIEKIKDGLPILAPCHDGCRCIWIPKLKIGFQIDEYERLHPQTSTLPESGGGLIKIKLSKSSKDDESNTRN